MTGKLQLRLGAFGGTVLTFPWELLETPNASSPCADGGDNGQGINTAGCADRITFSSQVSDTVLTGSDGVKYKMVINGFYNPEGKTCPATMPSQTQNVFWTAEKGQTSACIYGSLTQVRSLTIAKALKNAEGVMIPAFPFTSNSDLAGSKWKASGGGALSFNLTPTPTTPATKSGEILESEKVTVTETIPTGWSLESVKCVGAGITDESYTVTGNKLEITAPFSDETNTGITCTYTNTPTPGKLEIKKAFDNSVPSGSGTNTVFNGAYSCKRSATDSTVVASGTWTRTGTGAATLTPNTGTPAVNAIPQGAVCSATETQPTGNDGLPNSSWEWDTYSVSSPVTIEANKTGTLTVTNKAKRVYGNFSVTKIVPEGSTADASNTYSGNWSCTLDVGTGVETVTGTWGPIKADETWTSTATNKIPLGANCKVTSETRPENPVASDPSHQWDGDATFSDPVEAKNAAPLGVVTVTNKTKQTLGSVIWTKKDDQTPATLLGGSEWTIVGPNHNAPGTLITDCVADDASDCTGLDKDPAAGKFKLEGLAWGDYTVTETKAPTGHTGNNTFTFTVNATTAGTEIDKGSFTNPRKPGTVTWGKVDDQTSPNPLGGSEWTLTGPGVPAGTVVVDCAATPCLTGAFTDQDQVAGQFKLEGLAWGDYTLKETKSPTGHTGNKEFNFTVDATNADAVIPLGSATNSRMPGTVIWSKVDDQKPANLLGGSVWTIVGEGHPAPGTEVADCVADPCTGLLDQNPLPGQFRLIDLAWGTYTITEKTAPTGHVLGDPAKSFTFTVEADNAGTEISGGTHENPRKPGTVIWSKVDDQDEPNNLGGSKWTIVGPDAAEPGIEIDDCTTAPCDTGAFHDQDPDTGKFKLEGLKWGSYTVTETTTPEGHTGTASFTFEIDADNAGTVIDKGPFKNMRIPGTVVWSKVAAGTTDRLAGSKWKLTGPAPSTTEVAIEDCIATNATSCTGLDKDPAAGEFKLEGLAWGDYTLTETQAPPGYKTDNTPHPFTIEATHLDHSFQAAFENVQQDGPTLPMTGGFGRDHVYLAGLAMLLLSMAAYGTYRVRGRRNPRGI